MRGRTLRSLSKSDGSRLELRYCRCLSSEFWLQDPVDSSSKVLRLDSINRDLRVLASNTYSFGS